MPRKENCNLMVARASISTNNCSAIILKNNIHAQNVRRLTAEQKSMLLKMSDNSQGEKLIYFTINPDWFMDLSWLIFFNFAKLEEKDGQLVACITLPGLYARGLITQEQQA